MIETLHCHIERILSKSRNISVTFSHENKCNVIHYSLSRYTLPHIDHFFPVSQTPPKRFIFGFIHVIDFQMSGNESVHWHTCAWSPVIAHLGQMPLVLLHNNIQPIALEPVTSIVLEDHGGSSSMWFSLLFAFWPVSHPYLFHNDVFTMGPTCNIKEI